MRIPASLSVLVLLAGCRSIPHIEVVGGELRNLTSEALRDVTATHRPSGRTFEVNHVLPGASFQLGLAPSELASRSVTITWRTDSGLACERTLDLVPPPKDLRSGPCWIVYSIAGPNEVSMAWERPPPGHGPTGAVRL